MSDTHIVTTQGGCCGWFHLKRRQRTISAPQMLAYPPHHAPARGQTWKRYVADLRSIMPVMVHLHVMMCIAAWQPVSEGLQ